MTELSTGIQRELKTARQTYFYEGFAGVTYEYATEDGRSLRVAVAHGLLAPMLTDVFELKRDSYQWTLTFQPPDYGRVEAVDAMRLMGYRVVADEATA